MKNSYFHRVQALTPTKMWINNVTRQEARMAIDAGAWGCTQNPSYTWKMLNHPQEKEAALKLLDETLKESSDDNEVVCIFQRKMIAQIAQVFMEVYERTNGRHGYVSIQGDPIHEEDAQVIIDEGRRNRAISPNMMIKIPATEAGLEAMNVLIEENTPLNATEVMGVAQMVDVCEMYQKITAKTKTYPVMYFSVITGIYDEWLAKEVAAKGYDIDPDILYQAGMVIAKKVYQLRHDRGYPLGFIGGGVRGMQHFTEMVGGDVCITMNWDGQVEKLLELDLPVVSRLFNPVQDIVLDQLLEKVPPFRQAYLEQGLAPHEYEHFGPVMYFRDMFVSAWKNVQNLAADRRTSAVGVSR
jgi:transaldolase